VSATDNRQAQPVGSKGTRGVFLASVVENRPVCQDHFAIQLDIEGFPASMPGQFVNIGQTPVAALGATDQHSQVQLYIEGPNDKVHTFWTVAKHKDTGKIPKAGLKLEAFDYLGGQTLAKLLDVEQRSTAAALVETGRPNCTFTLDRVDAEHIGAFFQLLEFETAFMGELLNINAFDQEGVEHGKRFTYGLMGRKNFADFATRFKDYEKTRAKV
jgi:glucose-6-phosphate isomerase